MSSLVTVSIHSSQFPEQVRRDLLESLRTRQVNHKFHYDSIRQTQKWLELHQAYSPSRTDEDCAATYDRSFEAVLARISPKRIQLVGLGCGGGQKDVRLLKLLQGAGKQVFYSPVDVSPGMVLVARQTAMSVLREQDCSPLVCDLATAEDLALVLDRNSIPEAMRMITLFGMMPNFEPDLILHRLSRILRPGDFLLCSANLAPGADYAAGVQRILPLYDNPLTRDWLMTFLLDLGVEQSDGNIRFVIEEARLPSPLAPHPSDGRGEALLKRVAAYFEFARPRQIEVGRERFEFRAGEAIRLFFSYRHTPALVHELLACDGLNVLNQWITKSAEEGVFLVSPS